MMQNVIILHPNRKPARGMTTVTILRFTDRRADDMAVKKCIIIIRADAKNNTHALVVIIYNA
jgi:hypothetical protein